ncbi:hypothetical protein MC916_001782 [Elizabethkingia anophelis]|uniref:hypothetical protein n=1 Tax=Elizabethkingia anophelis TaxID=1117645 RepID=UPI001D26C82B|nr:hypothetical protein [Elizabethkingia anophelis]EKU4209491.1 hypothetical protein [Elizabethkingia anophelis]EKW9477887.1 hypothetical protein [Elizabethkingia anophelis]EKX6409282.1 hypothetical protein [Elizabethkingia anophelis]EKX6446184.1 hypothetical protein [Elizabethkingia anophelis]ELA7359723.1 hypothetical protein [Elizabethkingia anophelis]
MERIFKTPYSSMDDQHPVAEVVLGVSDTVPDQSLTVREILDKFANGTLGDIAVEKYYNDDDDGFDGADLRGLDIVELEAIRHEAQMDIDEIDAMIKFHEQTTGNQESNPSPTDTLTTETPDHI